MKRIISFPLLGVLSLLLFSACGDDDVEEPNPQDTLTPLPISQAFLTGGMTFDSAEDAKTFHFKSSSAWTAKLDVNPDEANSTLWCTIDKTEGEAGAAAITVYCLANKDNQDHTATLTIANEGTSLEVHITQSFETFLELSEYDVVVSDSSNLVTINISYNVDHYSFEIPSEASSWISSVGTRARKEGTERFQIEPNPHQARSTSIPFNACDASGKVLFTQHLYVSQISAPSYLIGRQEDFVYSGSGTSQLITLQENGSHKHTGDAETIQTDITLAVSDSLATLTIPSMEVNGGTLSTIRLEQLLLAENEAKTTTISDGLSTALTGSFTRDGKSYPISGIYMEVTATAWEITVSHLQIYFGENEEYILSIKYFGHRE